MPMIINVENVQKSFRIYSDKKHTLKDRFIHFGQTGYVEHTVLKGVNLHVQKGDTVALIGENGSGKSTLLKLMSGIMYPDVGQINMNGKVSSLLELGAGFHPDFSGRENVYNNASIFGLSRKQIEERFDQIVAFSELEEFINNPVRTYSSGMYMRLAFSVAINVDADILLIDEILAVGDAHFQKKCLNMIRKLKQNGVTIILVTHDMSAVESISDYAVWLEDGIIRESGQPRLVIDQYLLELDRKSNAREASIHPPVPETPAAIEEPHQEDQPELDQQRWGNQAVSIKQCQIVNRHGQANTRIESGDPVSILIHYTVNQPIGNIVFGITVNNAEAIACVVTDTLLRQVDTTSIPPAGYVQVDIHALQLTEGTYTLDVSCHDLDGNPYDFLKNAVGISIFSTTKDAGVYIPDQKWSIHPDVPG